MDSLADVYRLLNNVIRFGTVAEIEGAQCRVRSGEVLTDFLPWLVTAAGEAVEWSAPSIGEQVVVLSPAGDLSGGVVLRGLYSTVFAPPETDPAIHVRRYGDGAILAYDAEAHTLSAVLPDGAAADLTAPGGVTIKGNVTITGDVSVSGTVTAETDVVAGGISTKGHKHGGVYPGSGTTDVPQ